jgi:hypothetical protein
VKDDITRVGLDAHKETIQVVMLVPGHDTAPRGSSRGAGLRGDGRASGPV